MKWHLHPAGEGKCRGARLFVAELRIEAQKLRSVVDETQGRHFASGIPQMIFGGRHELFSDSFLLVRRIDGEQPDVPATALRFYMDATEQVITLARQ